jgi:hypothetical protein
MLLFQIRLPNVEKQEEMDEQNERKKKRVLSSSNLSFYKVIHICIDYYLRTSRDSLLLFISSINYDEANTKLDDLIDGYSEDMCVRFDIFMIKYHEFCTKYG